MQAAKSHRRRSVSYTCCNAICVLAYTVAKLQSTPYIRRRLVTFNAMGIFPANNMVGANCFMCDRALLRVPRHRDDYRFYNRISSLSAYLISPWQFQKLFHKRI